jgi:hypothetical protein
VVWGGIVVPSDKAVRRQSVSMTSPSTQKK